MAHENKRILNVVDSNTRRETKERLLQTFIFPCDYENDHETYINVGLLEVVIEYKDNEGCVEHKGKNSGKN